MVVTSCSDDDYAAKTSRLGKACYQGDYKAVKHMLANENVDPSANNHECIKAAYLLGHDLIVQLLLQDCRSIHSMNIIHSPHYHAIQKNKLHLDFAKGLDKELLEAVCDDVNLLLVRRKRLDEVTYWQLEILLGRSAKTAPAIHAYLQACKSRTKPN
jgi:hypothetical protein